MDNSLKSGLYIVATPIGNLKDITLRAVEVLTNSDIILCEDTRITLKLLSAYNIKVKLLTYNDHSTEQDRKYIRNLLDEGKIISLVSDAGTPLLSDPGYKLVQYLKSENLYITSLPGGNSILTALTLSGLASDKFGFYGFIPNKDSLRTKFLEEKQYISHTMIFFETANRLLETLSIIKKIYADRKVVIARELTKKFEEIKEGTATELMNYYQNNTLKGEIVMLISGFLGHQEENFEHEIKILLKYTNVKTASYILSELKNINKTAIYKQALKLQK